MKALFKTAADIQKFLLSINAQFAFIGGIALQRWGETRLTRDADLTLFTGFGNEEKFIDKIIEKYNPRTSEPKAFALKNRVLLVMSQKGIGIDIAMGSLPYEQRLVKRATTFQFLPKIKLKTCSAEDLIVTKAFASRDQDWLDIKGIIIRQGEALNWNLITEELQPLCELKEEPEILQCLIDLRKKLSQ